MAEFIEAFKKDPIIQNDISQIFDKYNKETFTTTSRIGQNALV